MVPAPLLRGAASQSVAGFERLVARLRSLLRGLPRLCVLARRNHRPRPALNYRHMTCHGAVDTGPPFIAWDLAQQLGQQGRVQTHALAHGQAEQALDAQREVDSCIGEEPVAPSLATCRGVPPHIFVQPDRQRPSGFKRGVVRCPVCGLVAGLGTFGFSHTQRLPAQRASFVQQSHTFALLALVHSG